MSLRRVGDPPQNLRVERGVRFYEGEPPNQFVRVLDFTADTEEARLAFFEHCRNHAEERNRTEPGHLMPELMTRVIPPWEPESTALTEQIAVDEHSPFTDQHEVTIEVVLWGQHRKRLTNKRLVHMRLCPEALPHVLASMVSEVQVAVENEMRTGLR